MFLQICWQLHTRLSQFNGPSNCPTPLPHQRANSRFFSFLYHFKSHMVTELSAKPQFHPSSWTRNTVASIMHKLDRSVVEIREPPVFFNCTAGKPVCVFPQLFLFITDSFSHRGTITQERSQLPLLLSILTPL
jgi:hypothetical protein